MKKIRSITEAFSMQPKEFIVEDKLSEFSNPDQSIKSIEIVECVLGYDSGNPIQVTCYVGFNFNGKMMFQYMCNTVNVQYQTES